MGPALQVHTPPKKTTRRPLRGAAPACQRTPVFATVSGEIFTFWIGAQNLAWNCCDFDGGICGRGTDSHTGDTGGQGRPPLRTLSLRGAKRRGNPFPFSEGRIPTPVTRSLARNDSASRCSGGQSRPPLRKMATLSGGHFLRFYALVSEPARPRWGCWRPETHRCRCAWWWRRPC